MIYYKSIKIIINAPRPVKIIINVAVHSYGVLESIVTNRDLLFTLKF